MLKYGLTTAKKLGNIYPWTGNKIPDHPDKSSWRISMFAVKLMVSIMLKFVKFLL